MTDQIMLYLVRMTRLLSVVLLGGVISGCTFSLAPPTAPEPSTSARARGATEFSYLAQSRAEQIAQADAVFIGRVTAIEPAQWNQDSGEYWSEQGVPPLPYHTIDVAVVRPLFDRVQLGAQATLTVIGGSPAGTSDSARVAIGSGADYSLQPGDERIFFVSKRSFAWRGGTVSNQATRPALMLMGDPRYSYLKAEGDDLYRSEDPAEPPISLDDLIAQLQERQSR